MISITIQLAFTKGTLRFLGVSDLPKRLRSIDRHKKCDLSIFSVDEIDTVRRLEFVVDGVD